MQPYVFAFADNGNITAKTDAGGKYIYHPTKINAVQYIKDYTSAIPPLQQDITYTPFLRPLKITEGVNELEYTYASDYERRKGVLRKSGAIENTRLYLGDYEINTDKNGVKTFVHYISGGEAIIVKRDNAAFEYYFPYTDHLGSIIAVTNLSGTVVAEQNFDAWGRKRNPTNWSYDNVPSVPSWLYRGYTGHEHLSEFNLINMNARLYDPVLGRMLSPDNFVQDYFGSQAFNRYSYANNNPLRYTDPSGNIIPILAIAGEMILQGAISVAINGAINWAKGDPFFQGAGRAFVTGAISSGVGSFLDKGLKITGFANNIISGVAGYVGSSAIYGEVVTAGGLLQSVITSAVTTAVMPYVKQGIKWAWGKVIPKKVDKFFVNIGNKVAEKFKGWFTPSRSTTSYPNAHGEVDAIFEGNIVNDYIANGWEWNGSKWVPPTPDGMKLALGLDMPGNRVDFFANSIGATSFGQFNRGMGRGFKPEYILQEIQNPNNSLHFNLTGMSRTKFNMFDPNGVLGQGNYTNWELHNIINTTGALNRTTFYMLEGGVYQQVSKPNWIR